MEMIRFYPKRHQRKLEASDPRKPRPTMEERMSGILKGHALNAGVLAQMKEAATTRERGVKRAYVRNRKKADAGYRLLCSLRSRLRSAFKAKTARKCERTLRLLGCSIAELREHLARQFKPGMTWENYREWEIDHIRPCASFNFTRREDQRECFHFSNLQPLWKHDNRAKSCKWKHL